MLTNWKLSLIAAATVMIGNAAWGQGWGANSGQCGQFGGYGGTNCGRVISQHDAAGLWENYCNETCFDFRRQRHHRFFGGSGVGCGSCINGGFGYPTGCGGCGDFGGCHGEAGVGGGRLQGSLFGNQHDCGHHRHPFLTSLFHRHRGDGCGSHHGCGLFSRLFHHHRNRDRHLGQGRMFRFFHGCDAPGLFATSAANCGTNGAYFGEGVGYEYGTGEIQSSVRGCGSATEFHPPAIDTKLHSYGAPRSQPNQSNSDISNDLDLPIGIAPQELID